MKIVCHQLPPIGCVQISLHPLHGLPTAVCVLIASNRNKQTQRLLFSDV
uniref:Uncharacterized protein n=1 Tax=Arundo donax TaxID=35708 RepID=A0A0A8YQ07_ARUDO